MTERAKDILEDYANYYSQVDCERLAKYLDNIKTEAIKEFAERLKEGEVYMRIEFPNTKNGTETYVVLSDDIDNLVKEMTEQKNDFKEENYEQRK